MPFESVNLATVLSDRKAAIFRDVEILENRIIDLGRESSDIDALLAILNSNPNFERIIKVLRNVDSGSFRSSLPESIVPVIP